jgi:hypothetical protein
LQLFADVSEATSDAHCDGFAEALHAARSALRRAAHAAIRHACRGVGALLFLILFAVNSFSDQIATLATSSITTAIKNLKIETTPRIPQEYHRRKRHASTKALQIGWQGKKKPPWGLM